MSKARLCAAALLCVLLGVLAGPVSAMDTPDFESNIVTGHIESVDSVANGSNRDVRHIIDHGHGVALEIEFLTTAPEDDLAPRIAIKQNGAVWITWWRDAVTDQVLYRARSQVDGTWGAETKISSDGENSRYPDIAVDDSTTWIAYQFDSTVGSSVAIVSITDGPEPFPTVRTVLSSTAPAGDLDVLANCESGKVWVTWVDIARVGWSKYDANTKTWSLPAYELDATSDWNAARGRIRSTVLGK